MAVCEYGSEPVSGAPLAVTIGGEVACLALGIALGPYFGAACALMVPFLVRIDDLCANPPPAPALPDIGGMIASGEIAIAASSLTSYLLENWTAQNWNLFCQCKTSSVCLPTNITSAYTFVYPTVLGPWNGPYPLPGAVTAYSLTFNSWTEPVSASAFFDFELLNGAGVKVGGGTYNPFGHTAPYSPGALSIPGTTTQWRYRLRHSWGTDHTNSANAVNVDVGWTGTCTTSGTPYVPPALQTPDPTWPALPAPPTSCSTDDLCQRLDAIERAIGYLTPKIITPTAATPTLYPAYRIGTRHTALTGQGTIALASGILGLNARFTAWPSSMHSAGGDPTAYFKFGWVTPRTVDGWMRSTPLYLNPQLILPIDSRATSLGYDLYPGVVGELDELVPA